MHVAFIVLSVLLALAMAGTGAPKTIQLSAVRSSAEHLGVSVALDRMIGLAEIAAALGLLLGIAFPALSIVTGAAVFLLMCGAIGYHIRAQDKVTAMLPAVLTAAIAVAVVLLVTLAPGGSTLPSL
jgi:DoxX-like family